MKIERTRIHFFSDIFSAVALDGIRSLISQTRHRHIMNYFRRIHLRKGRRKEIGDVSARKLRIQRSKKSLFLSLYFISYNKVHFFELEILPFSGKATIMPVHRIEILFPRRQG